MDADKQAQLQSHVQAIAALLYEETNPEELKTLSDIEQVVRNQVLEHVSPEIGNFLSKTALGQPVDANE